ncbi:hypothetical protein ABH927_005061 [Planotetraspora sp. GP83]
MAVMMDGLKLIRQGLEILAAEPLLADPFETIGDPNAGMDIERAEMLAKARAQVLAGQVQALQELVADLEVESARRLHRFSEMDGARLVGQRSSASFLQQVCGLRDGESVARARVAEWFERLEPSLEALSRRRIGLGHLLEIAHGVEHAVQSVDTARVPKGDVIRRMQVALLDHAGLSGSGMSPRRLHAQARREAWNLDPTLPDRLLAKHHRHRAASFRFVDGGAGFEFHVKGEGAGGALLKELLEGHSIAPAAGDRQPAERRRYDAFICGVQTAMSAFTGIRATPTIHSPEDQGGVLHHETASDPEADPMGDSPQGVSVARDSEPVIRGGARCQVRLIVPWSTLTGEPGSPPAETDWGQLLPPAAVRALAKDATVTAIIADAITGEPLNAGRARRLFSTRQRVALSAQYRTCQWHGGCDVPLPWTDIDHDVSWWAGGDTDIDKAKPLCHVHNLEIELIRSEKAAADPALRPQAVAVRDRLRAILRESRRQRRSSGQRLTAA